MFPGFNIFDFFPEAFLSGLNYILKLEQSSPNVNSKFK